MIRHLVTHDGTFHADEAFATALLGGLFPRAALLRTRDGEEIAGRCREGAIVYDIGGRHDPEARIFDHHQPDAPRREDGTPFSAFGLVWQHFGRDWLRSDASGLEANATRNEDEIAAIHAAIDTEVVRPIDLIDNGVTAPRDLGPAGALSAISVITALNPAFDAGDGEDDAFLEAVALAEITLRAHASRIAANIRAKAVVLEAVRDQRGSPVLVLPKGVPLEAVIERAEADHVLFVVRPRRKDWSINGVPVEKGSFTLRRELPAHWAGLEGKALQAASGVEGALFAHKGRFMATARDRESILALAEIAIREPELAEAGS